MAFTHNPDQDSKHLWQRVPEDTDVLVTHGPPYGILDRNWTGQRLGDRDLLARVRVVRPRLHLFGHVHNQNGRMMRWGTTFVNAAIADLDGADLSGRIQVIYRAITAENIRYSVTAEAASQFEPVIGSRTNVNGTNYAL